MTPPSRDHDERVFLVRMRAERSRGSVVWRGSVHDVTDDARRYIASPSEVAEFIATRLLARGSGESDA